MKDSFAALLLALQFLTRLPLPASGLYSAERMARSVDFFPAAGALIGALLAALFWLCAGVLPVETALCLTLTASLLLTGAFHEDGLADTFDSLGARNPHDRLRIMRDSRIGSYGSLALIASFALRWAALAALPATLIPLLFILGHGLSRLSAVLVIAASRYVRREGAGKPVAEGISRGGLIIACGTGLLLLSLGANYLPLRVLALAVLGLLAAHGWLRWLMETHIGGYTGDTLGATQQVSEIAFYLGCAAGLGAWGMA